MKYLIFILILLSFQLKISAQNFDNINVDIDKLEFNTGLSEISCDYFDGSLFYFQNKKAIKRYSQYYDLFSLDSSSLNKSSGDNNKVSLTKQLTIVTDYHEGPCHIDEINNKIYITISSLSKSDMKREKKLHTLESNRLRLLEGDFNNGIISNLQEFSFNNPAYNIAHATYSNATKRLYFASSMPGGNGGSDIFYCTKNPDGTWGLPINIGKRVNSSENEMFPQVKNGVLFFATNGQKKQVGKDLDIYYIKESDFLTESPKPLEELNSSYDDYAICFTDDPSTFEGYLTSNRDNSFSENDDIYHFDIKNVVIEKTYDLFAQVKNNEVFMKKGNATLLDEFNNKLATVAIDDKRMFYFPKLEKGKKYKMSYSDDLITRNFSVPVNNYYPTVNETFNIESDAIYKDTLLVNTVTVLVEKLDSTEKLIAKVDTVTPIKKEEPKIVKLDPKVLIKDTAILATVKKEPKIEVKVKKEPAVVTTEVIKFDKKETFENIYFAFDSYTIYPYSKDKLDKLIAYMKSTDAKYLVLEAFTDSRGSSSYNEKLSVKRALACREYLLANGITEDQIRYTGFGEKKLVNECGNGVDCPESQHKLNRRIEFTVIY